MGYLRATTPALLLSLILCVILGPIDYTLEYITFFLERKRSWPEIFLVLSVSSIYWIVFVLALMAAVTTALMKAQPVTTPWRWRYALLLAFAIGVLPLLRFWLTLRDIDHLVYFLRDSITDHDLAKKYSEIERAPIALALIWRKYVSGGLILLPWELC